MARRRSESNMFLDSQESANISGNEKKNTVQELPEEETGNKGTAVKTAKKSEKTTSKKESTKSASETITVPSSVSDVLSILASTKETRQNGVAKSIYLDKDVHDRVLALSEQSGIPFSKIINMLLKAAFRDSEA